MAEILDQHKAVKLWSSPSGRRWLRLSGQKYHRGATSATLRLCRLGALNEDLHPPQSSAKREAYTRGGQCNRSDAAMHSDSAAYEVWAKIFINRKGPQSVRLTYTERRAIGMTPPLWTLQRTSSRHLQAMWEVRYDPHHIYNVNNEIIPACATGYCLGRCIL